MNGRLTTRGSVLRTVLGICLTVLALAPARAATVEGEIIENRAQVRYLESLAGEVVEVESNRSWFTVAASPPAHARPAAIRFLMASPLLQQTGKTPRWGVDEDFVDTDGLAMLPGADNALREGLWIELDGVVAASERYLDDNGVAHVRVRLEGGADGSVSLWLRETEAGSERYQSLAPIALGYGTPDLSGTERCESSPAVNTTPPDESSSEPCGLVVDPGAELSIGVPGAGNPAEFFDAIMVSPVGRVFDSVSKRPVAGAVVEFHTDEGIGADAVTGEPLVFTSDREGRYPVPRLEFEPAIMTNGNDADGLPADDVRQVDGPIEWHLVVRPPSDYVFPSATVPADFDDWQVSAASYGIDSTRFGIEGVFTAVDTRFAPVIDIPLDPVNLPGVLLLDKQQLRADVEPGGEVGYELVLENGSDEALRDVTLVDTPPAGFDYRMNSSRLDGERIEDPRIVARRGSRDKLEYHLPDMAAGESLTLAYELVARADVSDGEHANVAIARATSPSGRVISSESSVALVNVERPEVFSGDGILFGKVYVDGDCNLLQNDAEWPIAGVRLFLDDGSYVITDADGQYSLFGLRTGLHVLRIDPESLPKGTRLKPIDNAHAADAESRYADLAPGEMHRADFAAGCPSIDREAYIRQLRARNRAIRGDWLLEDAVLFDPDARSPLPADAVRADAQGDLSHGHFGWVHKVSARSAEENGKTDDAKAGDAKAGDAEAGDAEAGDAEAGDAEAGDVAGAVSDEAHAPAAAEEGAGSSAAARDVSLDPSALSAGITREQAQAGTWLWPDNKYSTDGRFVAVIPSDLDPVLVVNGKPVPASQIGERIQNRREQAEIVTWHGVDLKPGENSVVVRTMDAFGNPRQLVSGDFKRPSAGAELVLQTRSATLPADDGQSRLAVDVLIRDANGYPASGVYFVSLGVDAGSIEAEDLQASKAGTQIRVDQGRARVFLRSGADLGYLTLRAESGAMKARLRVQQVAAARPLVAVGVVELEASDMRADGNRLPDGIDEGFETDARASLFLKGTVKGGAHMTLAWDSDKPDDAELLRDVNPNDFYPTFGDTSQRGFDAQSRSKLYFRLDKDRNSILWGDYLTDVGDDFASLSRMQRALTGFNGVLQGRRHRLQAFAAEVEEERGLATFRGNGTAMFYSLDGAPIVPHSEVVRLIVRDVTNPGFLVSEKTLTRYVDYTLDPISGLLSFRDPVPSRDEDFNPVFVQVSYQRDSNLGEHAVYGLRGRYRIADPLELGFSFTRDESAIDGQSIAGLDVHGEVRRELEYSASIAWQEFDEVNRSSARAERVKLLRRWKLPGAAGEASPIDGAETEAVWARSDTGFDNADGGLQAGREEWRLTHRQPLGNDTRLDAEWLQSRALINDTEEVSVGARLERRRDRWRFGLGLRRAVQSRGDETTRFNAIRVGIDRDFTMSGRQGRIGVDYEFDPSEFGRFRYEVRATSEISENINAQLSYRQQNGISESLFASGDDERQLVFGLKSDLLPNTELYSEYRMRGNLNGRNMETASGARGRYEIRSDLFLSAHLEFVDVLGESEGQDSVAASIGLVDKRNPNRRLAGQFEFRQTDSENYHGARASWAERLSIDWVSMLREEFTLRLPNVGEQSSRHLMTLGFAHRPRTDNRHHGLYMLKWGEERGPASGEDISSFLISTHQNRQFDEKTRLSFRVGGRVTSVDGKEGNIGSRFLLADTRLIRDIGRRFEFDLRAGWLGVSNDGGATHSLGFGLSWIVLKGLRLLAAYNFLGFDDSALDAEGYNRQGPSFGLEYKFDEDWFQWLSE
ncbi:MAG: hypothetical protein CSB44_09515 [Gammaproteobacteria bacterium]|nr:MAG: hypothetical protein CSB44_09515 [Gammaproteobacteria bacterium]